MEQADILFLEKNYAAIMSFTQDYILLQLPMTMNDQSTNYVVISD